MKRLRSASGSRPADEEARTRAWLAAQLYPLWSLIPTDFQDQMVQRTMAADRESDESLLPNEIQEMIVRFLVRSGTRMAVKWMLTSNDWLSVTKRIIAEEFNIMLDRHKRPNGTLPGLCDMPFPVDTLQEVAGFIHGLGYRDTAEPLYRDIMCGRRTGAIVLDDEAYAEYCERWRTLDHTKDRAPPLPPLTNWDAMIALAEPRPSWRDSSHAIKQDILRMEGGLTDHWNELDADAFIELSTEVDRANLNAFFNTETIDALFKVLLSDTSLDDIWGDVSDSQERALGRILLSFYTQKNRDTDRRHIPRDMVALLDALETALPPGVTKDAILYSIVPNVRELAALWYDRPMNLYGGDRNIPPVPGFWDRLMASDAFQDKYEGTDLRQPSVRWVDVLPRLEAPFLDRVATSNGPALDAWLRLVLPQCRGTGERTAILDALVAYCTPMGTGVRFLACVQAYLAAASLFTPNEKAYFLQHVPVRVLDMVPQVFAWTEAFPNASFAWTLVSVVDDQEYVFDMQRNNQRLLRYLFSSPFLMERILEILEAGEPRFPPKFVFSVERTREVHGSRYATLHVRMLTLYLPRTNEVEIVSLLTDASVKHASEASLTALFRALATAGYGDLLRDVVLPIQPLYEKAMRAAF